LRARCQLNVGAPSERSRDATVMPGPRRRYSNGTDKSGTNVIPIGNKPLPFSAANPYF
jgi:hypothetical protein